MNNIKENKNANIDNIVAKNGDLPANNSTNPAKKRNWFIRLWNYYSTYEKIWMFTLITAGIVLGILFPSTLETDGGEVIAPWWLQICEIIVIIGGCSCELLLSKQSKWAFIVSFVLYDLFQIVVYLANGFYVSALFEVVFWIPMLFISFFSWEKRLDKENKNLTRVQKFNFKNDLIIFFTVLAASLGVGAIFTGLLTIEGLSEWWYLDALANTFSVCNGLFLWLRYREQWIAWLGVCVLEAVMWMLSGQYIMLVLSLGYLMNSIYGLVKWSIYAKKHQNEQIAK